MYVETSPKLTRCRPSVCTICRHLTFESFLKHGRNDADLASTIALDCSLVLLTIFTSVLPTIKKMLKGVNPASQADRNQSGRPSTAPREERYVSSSSSAFSPSARLPRLSLSQPKTPPPRPARPPFPCSLAPLPTAHMRLCLDTQRISSHGGRENRVVNALTTMGFLHEAQSFSSREGLLDTRQEV